MNYSINKIWFEKDSPYKIYYHDKLELPRIDYFRFYHKEIIDEFFKMKAFGYKKVNENLANHLKVIDLKTYFQDDNHFWTMMWLVQSLMEGVSYYPLSLIIASEDIQPNSRIPSTINSQSFYGRAFNDNKLWYSTLCGNTRAHAFNFLKKYYIPSLVWTYNCTNKKIQNILKDADRIDTFEKFNDLKTKYDKITEYKEYTKHKFLFQKQLNSPIKSFEVYCHVFKEKGFGYFSNKYLPFQQFIIDLLKNTDPLMIYITNSSKKDEGVFENKKELIYQGFQTIPMEIELSYVKIDKNIFGRQKKGVYLVMTKEQFLNSYDFYNYLLLLNDKKRYWVNKDKTIYMVNAEYDEYEKKHEGLLP